MRLLRRIARHGVIGTLKLVPVNLQYFLGMLLPSQRAARRRDRDFDRRYGTRTSGIVPLGALGVAGESAAAATYYAPSPVDSFDTMMRLLPTELAEFRFIDYGSGRGRVLLLASCYPFKEVIGVEFSERLHRDAELNLQKFHPPERLCDNARSLLIDAALFAPPPGPTVFFLYNPFGRALLETVLRRIEDVHRASTSPLYLLYWYPVHQDLLSALRFWTKLGGSAGQWAVFARRTTAEAARKQ